MPDRIMGRQLNCGVSIHRGTFRLVAWNLAISPTVKGYRPNKLPLFHPINANTMAQYLCIQTLLLRKSTFIKFPLPIKLRRSYEDFG
jgi:hypothetical protein